jgi:hypothetical protein
MDKIRIEFFDILGYLIPGSAIMMVLWVASDFGLKSVLEIYTSLHKIDERAIYAGIVLSYIAGFTIHALGIFLYYRYRNLYHKNKFLTQDPDVTINEQWALVREYGEKHVPMLERWYALRALSQNLCAIAVISVIVGMYKWVLNPENYGWGLLILVMAILAWVLMERSVIFHKYLNADMGAVIRTMKLKERNK